MQRFLTFSLLFFMAVGPLTAQTSETSNPKESPFFSRQPNSPGYYGLMIGTGVSRVTYKDGFLSSNVYSGTLFNLLSTLEWEMGKTRLWGQLNISTGVIRPRKSLRRSLGDSYSDEYNFKFNKLHLTFRSERYLGKSSHMLGGFLDVNLVGAYGKDRGYSVYPEFSDVFAENIYSSAGLSYVYYKQISGVPFRLNATIPVMHTVHYWHGDKVNYLFSFDPSEYIAPTITLDMFLPPFLQLSYEWDMLSTNRATDQATYRHFHSTHTLRLLFGLFMPATEVGLNKWSKLNADTIYYMN